MQVYITKNNGLIETRFAELKFQGAHKGRSTHNHKACIISQDELTACKGY